MCPSVFVMLNSVVPYQNTMCWFQSLDFLIDLIINTIEINIMFKFELNKQILLDFVTFGKSCALFFVFVLFTL